MEYCKRCVMPDTKPGVYLDEKGICNACRSVGKKKLVDWQKRKEELLKLCKDIKESNTGHYDCIVATSGGKDSTYMAWYMKEVCGMKVLCACVLAHLQTKEGIENLNNMIEKLGVDTITIGLKPSTHRKLKQRCFEQLGEPNWAEHCAVFAGVARIAHAFKIPLTVWGEDISVEFGGKESETPTASAENLSKNDLVRGEQIDRWYDNGTIQKKYTFFYRQPPKEEMEKLGLKSIYLGYYDWWDGYRHYLKAKEVAGMQGRAKGNLSGNCINYDNIDEKLCEINIWLKYIKFGFWRPTDQCCYQIWNKRMTREEAVKIINRLQDQFPKEYFPDFLEFHGITQGEFWKTVEKFRNKEIWENSNGKWKLKKKLE